MVMRMVVRSGDAIDLVAYVDAISDGALVGVFGDQVLVEEAQGVFRGRGGQADEEGVEVLEHLAPEVVDRAVALVGDDEVEGLDGDVGVVLHGFGYFIQSWSQLEPGRLLQLVFDLLSPEHGVQTLDGGDGHLADRVDGVRSQTLDIVELGELATVVGREVALELTEGLPAQVVAIHQEEDASGTRKFDQMVNKTDGGEGLAAVSGHLDEGARAVLGEGLLQIGDGFDLGVP